MTVTQSSRALVLGGAGFIGRHLVRQLRVQFPDMELDVAGDRVSELPEEPGVRRWTVSLPDLLQLLPQEPALIYWAIGGASVAASVQDPRHDYRRSVPPLNILLEQLTRTWVQTRLVFISSAAVYGRHGGAATPTSAPLAPISPYGEHKLTSERMIAAFDPTGTRSHVVRPFSVYGPGLRKQLFWDALEKGRQGEFRFHGAGSELRDWLYVGDLVALLADMADASKFFPPLLNAGTGIGRRVAEVLELVHQLGGLPASPEFLGLARAGDPDRLVACPHEQQLLEGYFQTPLSQGLQRYWDWYRSLKR